MKYIFLTISFLITLVAQAQLPEMFNDISLSKDHLPKHIKRIEQRSGNTLLNIREYDAAGNLIFKLYKQYVHENWNGKYVIMIEGNEYDPQGRLLVSYSLHSNASSQDAINYYEYDAAKSCTKRYVKRYVEKKELPANTNPYLYIQEVTTFQHLVNCQLVKDMEKEKRELAEETYYRDSLIIKRVSIYSNNRKVYNYDYDEDHNLTAIRSEDCSSANYYSYHNVALFTEDPQYRLVQTLSISRWNDRTSIGQNLYSYNRLGQIIEDRHLDDGILRYMTTYEYDQNGNVIKSISHNEDNGLDRECLYEYNSEGYPIKFTNSETYPDHMPSADYKYVFEYYK